MKFFVILVFLIMKISIPLHPQPIMKVVVAATSFFSQEAKCFWGLKILKDISRLWAKIKGKFQLNIQ